MGILAEPLQFLRELGLPRGFSVCELGDQWITCVDPHVLARDYYEQRLRCGRYVSIDGNGRSGALPLDLNRPLPKALGVFDLVTDFGTGEHVFDQARVWTSVHYLTKPYGGYIAFDRPTQGYDAKGGHCYFNTHMCLFEDLAAANEYEIVRLEKGTTKRGELIRGVFRKTHKGKFVVPQQGRYKKLLRPITTVEAP